MKKKTKLILILLIIIILAIYYKIVFSDKKKKLGRGDIVLSKNTNFITTKNCYGESSIVNLKIKFQRITGFATNAIDNLVVILRYNGKWVGVGNFREKQYGQWTVGSSSTTNCFDLYGMWQDEDGRKITIPKNSQPIIVAGFKRPCPFFDIDLWRSTINYSLKNMPENLQNQRDLMNIELNAPIEAETPRVGFDYSTNFMSDLDKEKLKTLAGKTNIDAAGMQIWDNLVYQRNNKIGNLRIFDDDPLVAICEYYSNHLQANPNFTGIVHLGLKNDIIMNGGVGVVRDELERIYNKSVSLGQYFGTYIRYIAMGNELFLSGEDETLVATRMVQAIKETRTWLSDKGIGNYDLSDGKPTSKTSKTGCVVTICEPDNIGEDTGSSFAPKDFRFKPNVKTVLNELTNGYSAPVGTNSYSFFNFEDVGPTANSASFATNKYCQWIYAIYNYNKEKGIPDPGVSQKLEWNITECGWPTKSNCDNHCGLWAITALDPTVGNYGGAAGFINLMATSQFCIEPSDYAYPVPPDVYLFELFNERNKEAAGTDFYNGAENRFGFIDVECMDGPNDSNGYFPEGIENVNVFKEDGTIIKWGNKEESTDLCSSLRDESGVPETPPDGAACSDFTGCEELVGNCCPTNDGVFLGCCDI